MKKVNDIKYSKEARNFIKKAEPRLKEQLRNAINEISIIPPEGDVKSMEGYKDGRMRKRVGKYRIVFRYDETGSLIILCIIDIGPRGDIYK